MTSQVRVGTESVSTRVDGPRSARSLIVLGHGAGADMDSDFMSAMAGALAQHGLRVWRFNFLYSEMGRRAPDRQSLLEATFSAVLEAASSSFTGKILIGGKSLGGRIASHVATERPELAGLVFLGYPLHPPGRPERMRDQHLYEITAPMLFVEGTRDPFCPLPALNKVIGRMHKADLAVVDDGDHSLKVRKSSGRTTEQAWREAANAVADWIGRLP